MNFRLPIHNSLLVLFKSFGCLATCHLIMPMMLVSALSYSKEALSVSSLTSSSNSSLSTSPTANFFQSLDLHPYARVEAGQLLWVENRSYQYTDLAVGAELPVLTQFSESFSLNLSQSFNYSTQRDNENHPYGEVSDSVVGLKYKFDLTKQLELQVGGRLTRFHDKISSETTKLASVSGNSLLVFKASPWLSLNTGISVSNNLFRDQFDNYGNANTYASQSLSAGISMQYSPLDLSFASNFSSIQSQKYENAETQYYYTWANYLSYEASKLMTADIGLVTTNNQLENSKLAAISVLDDDVTMISTGLTFNF